LLRADVLRTSSGLMTKGTSVSSLRTATDQDAKSIHSLLERSGLPTADLESARPEFVVACDGPRVVGAGGLQRFGSIALLRSVAVEFHWRGSGVGRLIVWELERRAGAAGVTELVLLTQTAKSFFERQGYRVIERQSVSRDVQGSDEFRSLCPATAICMSKALA
jgi:amino-acid N-acetyltransferase